MPGADEPDVCLRLNRLDFLSQLRQRTAADRAQHVTVTPLSLRATGTKLSFNEAPALDKTTQCHRHDRNAKPVAARHVVRSERPVRSRVTKDEIARRVRDRLEVAIGKAGGKRCAKSIAIAAGILDGDESLLARDAHDDDAARLQQLARGCLGIDERALRDLLDRQIAEAQQQIVKGIGRLGLMPFVEMLQLDFERVQRVRVEQLAQLGLAEKLPELGLIDGQSLSAPLGQRRVAVVDEVRHVPEQQRPGEGRRFLGVGDDDTNRALLNLLQRRYERRNIEHIAEHLAIRLEDDRERSEARRHLQQVVGTFALLPEWLASVGAKAREQQRARGGFAELRGKHRAGAELADDELFDLVGIGDEQLGARRRVGVGEADDESIVAPHRLDLDLQLVAHLRRHGHGPGRVNASAERREYADPPVAEVVEHALDHDRTIVGDGAGSGLLILEVLEKVSRCQFAEVVFRRQALHGGGGLHGADLAHERADSLTEGHRALGGIGLPEGHLSGLARCRRDQHTVVSDLLDAPGGRAEEKRLADARLEHHLFIELADAGALHFFATNKKHAEEAAIGDRPATGDGDALRTRPRREDVCHAIPRNARPQLGEFIRGVEAGEHVEHAIERGPRQLCERCGLPDDGEKLDGMPRLDRDHGHDLLGQHVERIAWIARRLDGAAMHSVGDGSAGQKVAAEFRENDPLADRADLMRGATDALHAAGNRRRSFNLYDEIDGSHVDPELER